jgi:hypothetical protein
MSYSVDGCLLVLVLFLRRTGPILSERYSRVVSSPNLHQTQIARDKVRQGGKGSSAPDKQVPHRAWRPVRNDILLAGGDLPQGLRPDSMFVELCGTDEAVPFLVVKTAKKCIGPSASLRAGSSSGVARVCEATPLPQDDKRNRHDRSCTFPSKSRSRSRSKATDRSVRPTRVEEIKR